MSISAMKQALEALEGLWDDGFGGVPESMHKDAITALRQAIKQAEKQEPVFYVIQATDRFGEGYEQTYWEDPNGFPVYAAPAHTDHPMRHWDRTCPACVYESDISQECVDETAKDRHEPVAWREVAGKTTYYYDYNEDGRGEPLYAAPQPDLARVGEVGVWGHKREWVGLTDEERKAFSYFVNWEMLDQIEAKLKEKNT